MMRYTVRKSAECEVPGVMAVFCAVSSGWSGKMLGILALYCQGPNKPHQPERKYTLFDGLAYNTCGYFASCVVFFRAPQGRGKIRAMSKMSSRITC